MTDISESEKSKSITKDEMIGHIKKWIQYDNDIKQLQADLKEKKKIENNTRND